MGPSRVDVERLFEGAPDLLAALDRLGAFISVNPAWATMLGWEPAELLGRPLLNLVHPEDLQLACQEIARAVPGTPSTSECELRLRARDGAWRAVLWTARWDGERWAAVGKDVTARRDRERRALHDPLTGAANRVLALDRLGAAIARLGRSAGAAVVLLVDVDDLGAVNDAHGCAAGDLVLRTVADRLAERLRAADTVGRVGGDRFLVVAEGLADGGAAGVEAVIERVHGAFARPVPMHGGPLHVTGSVGVAVAREPATATEELVRDAEVALRRARRRGPGHAEVFDAALAEEVRARLVLAAQLRGALQRRELAVAFRPVAALGGDVVGREAQLRWRHPERGELGPDAFLRIAEQDGQIVALGAWLLEEACRDVAARPGDTWVSVALSARQLAQPDLLAVVERALVQGGAAPSSICLEVTEAAVLRRPEAAARTLAGLRRLGVRVALADTTSLTLLAGLPLDLVNVGARLARPAGSGDRAVLAALTAMAGELGLPLVAPAATWEAAFAA